VCSIPTALAQPSTFLSSPLAFSPSFSSITGTDLVKHEALEEGGLDGIVSLGQISSQATALPLASSSTNDEDMTRRLNPDERPPLTRTALPKPIEQQHEGSGATLDIEQSLQVLETRDGDASDEGLEKRWEGGSDSTVSYSR